MNKILLFLMGLSISTQGADTFFTSIKKGFNNTLSSIKNTFSSRKRSDALSDLNNTISSDFQTVEQEAQRQIAASKEKLKQAERKSDEIIDQVSAQSKDYFEKNKDKINQPWRQVHERLMTIHDKFAAIQQIFNKTLTTIHLMDLLDEQTGTLKQMNATKKAKLDGAHAKEQLNIIKDTCFKMFDEFEEELDDLIQELSKYEAKLNARSRTAEEQSRHALDSLRHAVKVSHIK